jgi:hypothetical protein
MSTFQPKDESFDDVTGHKLTRTAMADDEATDEVEGHKLPVRGAIADDEGVEGHAIKR